MTDKKPGVNMTIIADKLASGLANLQTTLNDKEALRGIMASIKAEHARRDACPMHHFAGGKVERFGAKYTCLDCGCVVDLTFIGTYIRGYVAAGRDANDIWPGWT